MYRSASVPNDVVIAMYRNGERVPFVLQFVWEICEDMCVGLTVCQYSPPLVGPVQTVACAEMFVVFCEEWICVAWCTNTSF